MGTASVEDPKLRPGYRPHRPPPPDPFTADVPAERWEKGEAFARRGDFQHDLMKNAGAEPTKGAPVEILPGQPLLARRVIDGEEIVVVAVSLPRRDYEHLLSLLKRVANARTLVERWQGLLQALHAAVSRTPLG